jgi:macrolide transport system ATP-binding/permease protein
MSMLRRMWNLFSRARLNREIEMELAAHIEMCINDNIARGMTSEQARRDALVRFGSRTAARERVARMDAALLLESIGSDFGYGFRQLVKNSGFGLTAVAVLALGICASASIFAFVDATLIKPLPYEAPSQLVGLFESNPLGSRFHLSYLDYLDWKKMNHVFSSVEAYDNDPVALETTNGVQRADGAVVGAGFFRMLGIAPILGRDFYAGEDTQNAPRTVILSYSAWQKRFGSSKDILGKTVNLDGATETIVGVLPRDFYFGPVGAAEFWMPIHESLDPELRGEHGILALARLKDGVQLDTARAEIGKIAQQLAAEYPDSDGGRGGTVVPLVEMVVGGIRPTLWLLLSAALLLLLIASINVSGLLLLRFQARQREIGVRSALGASPARLARQFTLEALVLTMIAGLTGTCAAFVAIHLLRKLIPLKFLTAMPYLNTLGMSSHVILFAVLVGFSCSVLFTLIGVLRLPSMNLRHGLSEGGRGAAGTVWRRLGANLVVLELCTATILLVGAGLLSKSLYQLVHTETGLQPDHLATLRLLLPAAKYPKSEQRIALATRIMAEVGRLPGVQSVAVAHGLPISNIAGGSTTFEMLGNGQSQQQNNEANARQVSANYFNTIGARLLQGRWFNESDTASRPLVAIVNRTFARKYFAGQNAIGKHFRFDASQPPIEIVGVVNDLKEGPLDSEVQAAIYTPFEQGPDSNFSTVARTDQAPENLLITLEKTIHRVDSDILTMDAETMDDRIQNLQSTYLHRSSAWLSSGFAVIALLLSVVGLYGVIAYSVSLRTREIGVRIALGASRDSVYRLILGQGGRLIGAGIVSGLLCALGTGTLMSKLLFHTRPWDTVTFLGVGLSLAISALLACLIPAHRAACVDPVDALRSE